MSNTTPIEHPSWLTTGDFTTADEPLRLFAAWLTDATASEPRDPTAMTLATVDADGLPNARMVLLKGADERGFVFYTNMDSQKGQELGAHPQAALVFYWKSSNRQVRVRGTVEQVSNAEADAYFASRPKQAQIGAWARSSQPRWRAGSPSRKRSRSMPRNMPSAQCRVRPTGRDIALCRCRSSSGRSGRFACTIASRLVATNQALRGARRGFIRKLASLNDRYARTIPGMIWRPRRRTSHAARCF